MTLNGIEEKSLMILQLTSARYRKLKLRFLHIVPKLANQTSLSYCIIIIMSSRLADDDDDHHHHEMRVEAEVAIRLST